MAGTVAPQEILSPELVLIDPSLAAQARASLSDPDDVLGRFGARPAASVGDETAAARRRLIELSVVEPPERRRSFRAPKLAGALATWTLVAMLVVDTQLYTWF